MTNLCTRCGFCCDGTLFDRVSVRSEEEPRIRGLPVINGQLRQPCGALKEGRCNIYEGRPARCAAYRCTLLDSFEAGRLDLNAALERVRRIKSLLGEITRSLPMAELDVWRRAAIALDDPAMPADRKADLLLKMKETALLLHRDFDERFDPSPDADRALY